LATKLEHTERVTNKVPAKTEENRPDVTLVPRLELEGKEPEQIVPELIEQAARLHVSDLYFSTEEDSVQVAARHIGVHRPLARLDAEIGRRCISYVKTMADMNISERRRPMDGRWLFNRGSGHRLDLRINTLPTLHGEDCTLRILDQ
jgi:general secretion pathway protein E